MFAMHSLSVVRVLADFTGSTQVELINASDGISLYLGRVDNLFEQAKEPIKNKFINSKIDAMQIKDNVLTIHIIN